MTFWRNLRWGVLNGLLFAGLFSAWVVFLAVLRGSTDFPSYGVTLWQIVASYVAGGAGAGLIVGAVRPVTRWRVGAVAVGVIAAVPVAVAAGMAMNGLPGRWSDGTWVGVLCLVIIVGPISGFVRWQQTYGRNAL